jgi:hypothetical protein
LTFFIFPPTRIHRNHQKHLIKRAKKFQEGKWEELWKQSMREYDIEMVYRDHIQIPKQKSIISSEPYLKNRRSLLRKWSIRATHRTRYGYKIYSLYQAKTTKAQSNYVTTRLTTDPRMMRYLKFGTHQRWRNGFGSITPSWHCSNI